MAMQPSTYSLNALSVELGIDRRTLAKRLADVPPAEVRGRSKRWRMQDVLKVADGSSPPATVGGDDHSPRQILEEMAFPMDLMIPWLCEDVVTLKEYAKQAGLSHEEVVELTIYGLPTLPPDEGKKCARVSINHAERWRMMFAGFLHSLGGTPENEHMAEEARRIRGLPLKPTRRR